MLIYGPLLELKYYIESIYYIEYYIESNHAELDWFWLGLSLSPSACSNPLSNPMSDLKASPRDRVEAGILL